ncbi:MAG TPA: hypothetical protein DD670_19405 [Planctomycetaceae bacterium]|nr:hypothetical protein [Planctomycetaceae bacterium]
MTREWIVLFVAIGTLAGCSQALEQGEPIRHEVRKPLAPPTPTGDGLPVESEPPVKIIFPEIPEVPESIQGPSRPFEGGQCGYLFEARTASCTVLGACPKSVNRG